MTNAEKLAKLKQELESMSLKHAEKMADPSIVRSPERLDAESKRARILARRIAQLMRALGESNQQP